MQNVYTTNTTSLILTTALRRKVLLLAPPSGGSEGTCSGLSMDDTCRERLQNLNADFSPSPGHVLNLLFLLLLIVVKYT